MPNVQVHISYVGNVTTTWGKQNPHSSDMNIANIIYAPHNIHVQQVGFLNVHNPDDYYPPIGILSRNGAPAFVESACKHLVTLSNQADRDGVIDVYYLTQFYSEDVSGLTLRPGGADAFSEIDPVRPIILINGLKRMSDSLAHELGHALLDDGTHTNDADNLMAAGSIRTGSTISVNQRQQMINSAYAN